MADSPRPRRRRRIWIALVIVVAVVAVTSLAIALEFTSTPRSHTICVGGMRLGNVSAWYPLAFAASPYGGTESGELREWTNYTLDGTWHNFTGVAPTSAIDGSVTLGDAWGGNWTIFAGVNQSVNGPGLSYPCRTAMIAFLGPLNGPASDEFGGGTIAHGLKNDTGMPFDFIASMRCESFGDPANCAVSATFDLNFTRASGSIDTCGDPAPRSMKSTGQELEDSIPFLWNGMTRSVPTAPTPVTGMTGWFNYTFPADFGIWQYQYLPGYAGGTSGLVFSYTTCPA